jgi:hypothetical protein
MADKLVMSAHVLTDGLVLHRFPRQDGQFWGIDAQHYPQPLPTFRGESGRRTIPPRHLAGAKGRGKKQLAYLPNWPLGFRQDPAAGDR